MVASVGIVTVNGATKFLRIRLLKNGSLGFEEEEDVFERGNLCVEGVGAVRGFSGFDFFDAVFNLAAVVGVEVFSRQ